jgi:hypothetical protein
MASTGPGRLGNAIRLSQAKGGPLFAEMHRENCWNADAGQNTIVCQSILREQSSSPNLGRSEGRLGAGRK